MPFDSHKVSEGIPKESLGSLGGCLVEGDPEQRRRARRVRRRALVLSILIQTAVLGVLVLLPLFGKTQHIALTIPTHIPPYSPYKGASHDAGAQHPHGQRHNVCHFCVPPNISPIIVTHNPQPSGDGTNDAPDGTVPGIPGGLIPIPGVRSNVPPPPDDHRVARPTVVRMTQIATLQCFALARDRGNRSEERNPWQINRERRVDARHHRDDIGGNVFGGSLPED